MKNNRYLVLFILLMCIPMMVSAFGKKETVIQVTGVVRLVGPDLFREIVITGSENEWYVVKDEMDKLYSLQHQRVTVEGVETVKEMTFASGFPAGTRRELKKIKIISVE